MMVNLLHRIGFSRKFSSFNFINIVKSSGYRCESHNVITEDGYILTLHRILPQKYDPVLFDKIPVLLQHGLWSSSEDWILPGPSKSVGYLLSEAGFDVWLGNTRGNLYSRDHVKYSPFKNYKEFWNFRHTADKVGYPILKNLISLTYQGNPQLLDVIWRVLLSIDGRPKLDSWHEMGYFDLPAMIDYILKSTSRKYLYYIGHSQGTTSFFVMGTTKPVYNDKVKAMFALAPVVYLRHMRNERLLSLASIQQPLFTFLNWTGNHKFVPREHFLSWLEKLWSKDFDKHSENILKNLSNYATPEVRKNLKNILLSHVSCGTSFKQLAHFAQCTLDGKKFRQFDYGCAKNLEEYGNPQAPVYDLKNISVPIVLFHSDSDWLTHPKDVNSLLDELPSDVLVEKVDYPKFNHLDFLWADFKEYKLYDTLIKHFYYFEKCH